MNEYSYSTFFILAAAGCLGALAVIPYSLELASFNPNTNVQNIPIVPQILQGLIMAVFASGIGLLAARSTGLPVWSSRSLLLWAALAGTAAAVLTLGIEIYCFVPRMPAELTATNHVIALWKRVIVTLYGGITEELLMRLFLMSGIVWLLRFIWRTPQGTPADGAVWTAIILVAVLFGLGHLPAIRLVTQITPLLVIRALVLNSLVGILCGWLYWKYGFFSAVAAHFSADIVLHVITPLLLHIANDRSLY